jgi:uncharacterized cysteine cluster protein YcgN (CxxCxxCC family)
LQNKFWKNKKLNEFSEEEWESICSNCGKCCLVKLQDDETEEVFYTNLVCRYFDHNNCKCSIYDTRRIVVPECLKLDMSNIDKIEWMPKTCAYRILYESKDLPDWHPLVTGSLLKSAYSIKGRCTCQTKVDEDDWEDFIIEEDFL